MTPQEILDIKFKCQDFCHKVTLKQYLKRQLLALWTEVEQFSGKRPFGNSGWDWDIYAVLIRHDVIPGKLDSDGFIEEFDHKEATKIMIGLINSL